MVVVLTDKLIAKNHNNFAAYNTVFVKNTSFLNTIRCPFVHNINKTVHALQPEMLASIKYGASDGAM